MNNFWYFYFSKIYLFREGGFSLNECERLSLPTFLYCIDYIISGGFSQCQFHLLLSYLIHKLKEVTYKVTNTQAETVTNTQAQIVTNIYAQKFINT